MATTCKVGDCPSPINSRRTMMCGKHERRFDRYGDPNFTKKSGNGSALAWIRERVAQPFSDECLEWPFPWTSDIRLPEDDRSARPGHVMLVLYSGEVRPPEPGHFLRHSCDNPPCVNPRHLRWGTHAQNMADLKERRRHGMHRLRDLVDWLDEHGISFPDEFRPNG